MAFRVGLVVDKMARCIEPWPLDANGGEKAHNTVYRYNTGSYMSQKAVPSERPVWTFLMTGSDAEESLCQFNDESNVSVAFT